MRLLFLSLGACILASGAARAQNGGDSGGMPTLPVGQVFKQFEFPVYQDGALKATVNAVEARGITLNRIETSDLRIQIYENGAVTTTVTSPDADLYLNQQIDEQTMRTKNTVQIERADMTATSQDCNFDLKHKKYLLRVNVKVILKNFDISLTPANGVAKPPASTNPAAHDRVPPTPAPVLSPPVQNSGTLLDSPGAYANTNSAPPPAPNSDTK